MRILVVIGRVLNPRGITVNRRAGRVFVNREEYVMQPADRCALEMALRIKDAHGAEVIALPRGPLPDDDVLRQAIATGADRAIYLVGDGFAADDGAMAGLLAAAATRLGGADLILTGATTLDSGQGQLGPRLAEALGWPQVVDAWDIRPQDGAVQVVCRADDGFVVMEAPLPAVVTIAPGALKPRYPGGARLINIYKGVGDVAAALERWEVGDLAAGLSLTPLLEQRGQEFPPERERGTRFSGTPQELADALRNRLPR
jgi:electron transfer flavoprotein alpha/beta subunit